MCHVVIYSDMDTSHAHSAADVAVAVERRPCGQQKRGRIPLHEWERIKAVWGGRCAYCRMEISGEPIIEHVVPVSRGGSTTDPSNVVPACNSCNVAKGPLLLLEWVCRTHGILTRASYVHGVWVRPVREDERLWTNRNLEALPWAPDKNWAWESDDPVDLHWREVHARERAAARELWERTAPGPTRAPLPSSSGGEPA